MRPITNLGAAGLMIFLFIASAAETPAASPDLSADRAGYVLIPVVGTIGVHFTDTFLETALRQALAANPRYIVLELDSPGGSSDELTKITQRLVTFQSTTGIEAIACVRKAYSAAAIAAVACKHIFMLPGSTIGATAEVGGPRTDSVMRLKRDSVMRAEDRALAQFSGHDPLIVLGMFDPNVQLYLVNDADKPTIHLAPNPKSSTSKKKRKSAPSPKPPGRLLKDRNQLLTLTADDAVNLRFALAVVSDYDQIAAVLGETSFDNVNPRVAALALAHYKDAAATVEDVKRIENQILDVLARPTPANTADALARRLTELKGAKSALARISALGQKHPWLDIDPDVIRKIDARLDAEIARTQAELEKLRPRESTGPKVNTIRKSK